MAEGAPVQGQEPPQQGRSALFDPTQNVLNLAQSIEKLVAAAMQRQDDLRERDAGHAREMRETARRYEDRLDAKDQAIRSAETDRINAIRAVDVGAAAILANQVAASAEALRGQVEAARQQTATALAAALEPIQKDIQDLRRAQYETQGQKTQVVESRDVGADKRDSDRVVAAEVQARSARMLGTIGAVIGVLSFLITLYLLTRPGH